MKLRIKDTSTTIKILGFYQIICGLIGLIIAICILLEYKHVINGVALFFFMFAFVLYYFSIKSGGLLLQKNQIKRGLIYSIISNLFQVIAASTGGYEYEIYTGLKGIIGINFTNGFKFVAEIGHPRFNFSYYYSGGTDTFIYINIFAIIVLYVLYDIYKELYFKHGELNQKTSDNI